MVQWWAVLGGLAAVCACVKYADGSLTRGFKVDAGSAAASLRKRYLCVFWLVKLCDWMQGPYFYEVRGTRHAHRSAAVVGVVTRACFTWLVVAAGVRQQNECRRHAHQRSGDQLAIRDRVCIVSGVWHRDQQRD